MRKNRKSEHQNPKLAQKRQKPDDDGKNDPSLVTVASDADRVAASENKGNVALWVLTNRDLLVRLFLGRDERNPTRLGYLSDLRDVAALSGTCASLRALIKDLPDLAYMQDTYKHYARSRSRGISISRSGFWGYFMQTSTILSGTAEREAPLAFQLYLLKFGYEIVSAWTQPDLPHYAVSIETISAENVGAHLSNMKSASGDMALVQLRQVCEFMVRMKHQISLVHRIIAFARGIGVFTVGNWLLFNINRVHCDVEIVRGKILLFEALADFWSGYTETLDMRWGQVRAIGIDSFSRAFYEGFNTFFPAFRVEYARTVFSECDETTLMFAHAYQCLSTALYEKKPIPVTDWILAAEHARGEGNSLPHRVFILKMIYNEAKFNASCAQNGLEWLVKHLNCPAFSRLAFFDLLSDLDVYSSLDLSAFNATERSAGIDWTDKETRDQVLGTLAQAAEENGRVLIGMLAQTDVGRYIGKSLFGDHVFDRLPNRGVRE